MKITHRLAFSAIALGLVALLSGQTIDAPRGPRGGGPGGRGGRGRPPLGNPVVRAIDMDRNDELSAAELANAPAAIKTLDTNNDGKVSADELRPKPPADAPQPPPDAPRPPADRPHPDDPVMLALDANKDGELSAAEIANATASLKALDANGDGKLSPDEFRPLPPPDAPQRGPRGGR
jgi:hypothetical protein